MTEREAQILSRISELDERLLNIDYIRNYTHCQIAQLYRDLANVRQEQDADPA